jgi:histidyl-tRNA synthetase
MKPIEPRLLKGFRDYLPKEQIARNRMFEIIRHDFELFGFEPLETPVLEYEDILSGKYGEEGEKLMYRFKDNGNRDVVMRYDLTVPLARVVAQYGNEISRPFKRYQIAPVWRAENTQKGRYREFYQCDADIVGSEAGISDAECIALTERVLLDLGLNKFIIKISNRKILNAIMLTAKVPADKILTAIRAIDKIEKLGVQEVAKELVDTVGMEHHEAEGLIRLASTKVPDVGALKTFMNKHILKEPQGQEGFAELNHIFNALHDFGVKNIEIDLSLARGLDYYTSTIFETIIIESVESRRFGSIASGGRYDHLVNLFTGKDVPAVGFSIGIDRLFSAMTELGLVKIEHVVSVLILNLGGEFEKEYLSILSELRNAGISSEMYYQSGDIKKQFNYAESKSIPYAVLLGENELKTKTVTVRDLNNREQQEIDRKKLVDNLKARL